MWVLMVLAKVLQLGGILGGTAVAFSIMVPLGGDALSGTSVTIWHILVAALSIGLLYGTPTTSSRRARWSWWSSSPS